MPFHSCLVVPLAISFFTGSRVAVQGSRIRFFLGCVIPCAGAVTRSRNLGQALFGSPVLYHDITPFYSFGFHISLVAAIKQCRAKGRGLQTGRFESKWRYYLCHKCRDERDDDGGLAWRESANGSCGVRAIR